VFFEMSNWKLVVFGGAKKVVPAPLPGLVKLAM
jgi:hypothetical protein